MKNEPSIEIEDDEIICNCFQVTENTIRSHISKNDISQVEGVTSICEAGGNCGSCHILIQLFIDQNKHQKTLEYVPEPEISKSEHDKGSFWKKLLPSS
jgi:NAD(P)H-nitrite reductase large subunit